MGIFKLNGIDYMGGGGGNANEQVLTWEEYCALTEEEKSNGTTYYINDINGEGKDQFQPVIYSEEEREIGVWTDGKPLYQKTIKQSFTGKAKVTIATDIDYEHTIETTYYATGVYDSPMFITGATVYCYIQREQDNSLTINNEYNGAIEWIVTIQYTKTTDQPGSGTWTPQGVPAVHYSTEEHVVGTWIDGSTLYEKSYHVPTVTSTYITIDSTISASTIKLRDVSMGSIVIGGAYNNAQYVDGRLSYNSFIRVVLNVGLSVGMEAPPSDPITDFDFTIRYTKSTS